METNVSQDAVNCWVCLGSELQKGDRWVSPCKCSGTSKFAHENCILMFMDQKLIDSPNTRIKCPICLFEYQLDPGFGLFEDLFEGIERAYFQLLQLFLSTYLSILPRVLSMAYGSLFIVQVVGLPAAMYMARHFSASYIVIAQFFPILLLIFHLYFWDAVYTNLLEWIIIKWASYDDHNYPFLTLEMAEYRFKVAGMTRNNCFCRNVLDALVAPSLCYVLGNVFFYWIEINADRFTAGFFLFLIIKLSLSLYRKYSIYKRMRYRRVASYSKNQASVPEVQKEYTIYHETIEKLLFMVV